MARKKTIKTILTDFIKSSAKTFGYATTESYLNERASKNFVVLTPSGATGDNTYEPQFWEDGETLVVLNTEELAKEEAKEYEGATVVTELKLYHLLGIA